MTSVHAPQSPDDVELWSPARMRLAYDEYLAGQLALMIVRSSTTGARGIARSFTSELTRAVEAALPYALTEGQKQAIEDIRADLGSPNRMSRLLQGADRAPRDAALPDARADLRQGRHRHRAPHRQDAGRRPPCRARASGFGRKQHRRRHACAVPVRRRVPQSGAHRRRRAAPLRRAP